MKSNTKNIRKGIATVLFAVMIASVLALTVSPASATSLFLGPYELQNWQKTGPGTTSITPASGPACNATFSYDHTPSSYNWETWQFQTTAAQTETFSFDWEYKGCHSWYKTEARAYVFADGPSGPTTTTLYSGSGWCGFSASGSSSIQVNKGYSFGFIVKGKHFDSSRILRGSLKISDSTPPVITCPADVTVEQESAAGTVVPLTATATDNCDASPTITSDELAIYPLGMTTVTFTATDDSGNSASCSMTVTVQDTTPPVITCPADVTVEQATRDGTVVSLTATATDVCDVDVDITSDAPAIFPLGTTTVTFTATDDSGNSASCSMIVTVEDTTLPDISVVVSPDTLWSPNHKMVDIIATVTVRDICDAAPSVVLTNVTSNELDDAKGRGAGKTVNDIQGIDIGEDDYEFKLRAERDGEGDGRVYTITYTVTDASGNSANESATVVVPYDKE